MVCFQYCTKLTGIPTEMCSWTCCQDQVWLKQWCQRDIWRINLTNKCASDFTDKTKMAFFESCIYVGYLSNSSLTFNTLETFKNLLSACNVLSSKKSLTTLLFWIIDINKYSVARLNDSDYGQNCSKNARNVIFMFFKGMSKNMVFAAPLQDARGESETAVDPMAWCNY